MYEILLKTFIIHKWGIKEIEIFSSLCDYGSVASNIKGPFLGFDHQFVMLAPFTKLPFYVFETVLLQIKVQVVAQKVFVKSIVSIWTNSFRRATISMKNRFYFSISRPNRGEFTHLAAYCFKVNQDEITVGKLIHVIAPNCDVLLFFYLVVQIILSVLRFSINFRKRSFSCYLRWTRVIFWRVPWCSSYLNKFCLAVKGVLLCVRFLSEGPTTRILFII